MKAATIQEIRRELNDLSQPQLAALCLKLAKFKKENKELLTYLLFEAFDEAAYIDGVKKEIKEEFSQINTSSLYFVKKSLRKILRQTMKHIRYMGSDEAAITLLLFFCSKLRLSGIPYQGSQIIVNMLNSQVRKAAGMIASLHEDLQYEYLKELKQLQ